MGNGDMIYVNMATIPGREKHLSTVIDSLYGQANAINVYLNGFDVIPAYLNKPGINVARSQDHGDRGDAGKFFWSDKVEGYYLTVDDDIIYPQGYVKAIVDGIDARDGQVPVGMHGEMYKNEINRWTGDRLGTYHFFYEIQEDVPTCVLGTGCMGYHTEGLEVTPEDFKEINMADVWFTLLCVRQEKPRIVLKHPRGWLNIIPIEHEKTLWGKTVDIERADHSPKISREAQIIQECLPWKYLYDPIKENSI